MIECCEPATKIRTNLPCPSVTCAIMCQAGKGYSLWLCKSHEQEHPDVTANCDD